MASPDVLKSVSKKLKYYLEIQRLEDGFDLSGPDCPRMDHPPIRARSALLYSGLHDRPLKHYFHHSSVRNALTNFKMTDEKNSGQEEEIRRSLVKYMTKYRFNSPNLADEYYSCDSRAGRRLRPEMSWRGTPLVRGKMPHLSGNCVLRSVPPCTVSRTEKKRLLDSTCHLVLAAESGLNDEPESSEQENQEENTKDECKSSKQHKVNHKERKVTPSNDRSLNKPSQRRESTLVKRSHEDQSMKPNHGKHHNSESEEQDRRQHRGSSPESGNKQHKAATRYASAGQQRKTTALHSKPLQKTSVKEQPKEQRKTIPFDNTFSSGRISGRPNRAKSVKHGSRTYGDSDNISSLRNGQKKCITRSYDHFCTTIEIGTQTSGELLKHYNPSEQVLNEGPEVKYHIDVQTGRCAGAGTKAEIQIVLIGDLGRTEYLPLSQALTPHKIKFKRNQHDLFEVFCPSVGKLQQIKIGHEKKQAEYKWYVESVTVRDFARCVEYRIPCQKWLSGAFGDRETFGEFKVKSSSAFSADDVYSMDYDPEETYVAMVRTENRFYSEVENPNVVNKYQRTNSGSLCAEDHSGESSSYKNSQTTEIKNEEDNKSNVDQTDLSSSISKEELKIPLLRMTPGSLGKSGKPSADKSDDFFDQKVKKNDYNSIIENITSTPSDCENSNSVAPEYASGKNCVVKIENTDDESTDESDSEHSADDLESHSACALPRGTPTKVDTSKQKLQSSSCHQNMLDAVRLGSYSDVLRLAETHPELLEEVGVGEYAPIHVAAFYNRLEILAWLTSHMADVDRESKSGRYTALQLAALNGHTGCLKVLIDMGAKVNYRTSSGLTALHLAARAGKANSVKWLLENGADTAVRDSEGCTALDLAKEFNRNEIIQIIASFAMTRKKQASKKEV